MESLKINGVEKQFPESELPATLSQLLRQLGVDQATVVVEIDGAIIERKDFDKTRLQAGQSIELVRFVGGG